MDAGVTRQRANTEDSLWRLPKSWLWAELGEIGVWTSGGTPKSTEPDYYDGSILWFRITDLNEGRLRESEKTLTERGLAESSAKIIQAPFLMFAMYGASIGKMAISEIDAATNQAIACCTPSKDVEIDYLFWALQRFKRNIVELSQGGAQPNISQRILLKCKIPLAPLAEQRRIAARVDELFAEIAEGEAALEEVRKGLDIFRRALLKAAVTGELTKEWRAANPVSETGHDLLARIAKERAGNSSPNGRGRRDANARKALDTTALPEIPDNWAWTRVGDVTSRIEYGTSEKCDFDYDGVPVLRMGNVDFGSLIYTNLKYAPKECSPPLLQINDLVFNRTNSAELVGKCAVYKGEVSPCSLASYLIRVRFEGISSDFAALWINSAYGRKWIAANKSQQVGQANLSGGTLKGMPIPAPPRLEATEIVRRVSDALAASADTLVQLDAEASEAARLKQSILKAAFEGRLVPQDPADEPASAPLARVALAPAAPRVRRRTSTSGAKSPLKS